MQYKASFQARNMLYITSFVEMADNFVSKRKSKCSGLYALGSPPKINNKRTLFDKQAQARLCAADVNTLCNSTQVLLWAASVTKQGLDMPGPGRKS